MMIATLFPEPSAAYLERVTAAAGGNPHWQLTTGNLADLISRAVPGIEHWPPADFNFLSACSNRWCWTSEDFKEVYERLPARQVGTFFHYLFIAYSEWLDEAARAAWGDETPSLLDSMSHSYAWVQSTYHARNDFYQALLNAIELHPHTPIEWVVLLVERKAD